MHSSVSFSQVPQVGKRHGYVTPNARSYEVWGDGKEVLAAGCWSQHGRNSLHLWFFLGGMWGEPGWLSTAREMSWGLSALISVKSESLMKGSWSISYLTGTPGWISSFSFVWCCPLVRSWCFSAHAVWEWQSALSVLLHLPTCLLCLWKAIQAVKGHHWSFPGMVLLLLEMRWSCMSFVPQLAAREQVWVSTLLQLDCLLAFPVPVSHIFRWPVGIGK